MTKKSIGLCLSGGGHRATAFSLGALLYLADVGRHEQISAISSVSGGSLTSGFFATADKSVNQQTPEEVEHAVRTLAGMLTGRPVFFWVSLAVILTIFVAWFLHLIDRVSFGLSFWESELVFFLLLAAAAFFAGPLCGGTFWGWWGTWMYVGLVLVALVSGVAIWWSEIHWSLKLIFSVGAFSTPLLRCQVAEMAFAFTLFKKKRRGISLESLSRDPAATRHIFCATEMHTGEHAWFTHEFIYVPVVGIAPSKNLTVESAVQMSANFPIAFPYRLRGIFNRPFRLGEHRWHEDILFLMFSDGGLYDNMAISWFKEAPSRAVYLRRQLSRDHEGSPDPPEGDLDNWIKTMEEAKPDTLIVVNSSDPYAWGRATQAVLPLWGEGRMLVGINNSMYNQLGKVQKRSLRREFLLKADCGALVSIGEHPNYLVDCLRGLYPSFLTYYELTEHDVETIRAKALRMTSESDLGSSDAGDAPSLSLRIDELKLTAAQLPDMSSERILLEQQIWQLECEIQEAKDAEATARLNRSLSRLKESREASTWTKTSESVATTFRPLGERRTAALLKHGYLSAMTNCHLLLDFPLVDVVPPFEDFKRLANGLARKTRPKAVNEAVN